MSKWKYFVLCVVFLFFVCFSGNIDAYEYAVETVESTVETVENEGETFTKCAENDGYIMLADYNSGIIALENKSTGYTWYSSPPDAKNDSTASALIQDELLSSNTLRYGTPKKRTDSLLRSNTSDCNFTVSAIDDGIRITYDYSAGFHFPVDYVLMGDYLRASLKVSEIAETNPDNTATEVTVMGSFGASSGEDGYFVIPDGSGALVRFNSDTTSDTNAYSRTVYGSDVSAVPDYSTASAQQIYLSAFGIVRGDNAMLVVASKGDSNACITAKIAGQSNSSYNLCNFTFVLRNKDTFYMSGSSTDKFTVFESGDICADDIELRYYPISKKDADYIDIAEKYREYINITPKKSSPALYVNLYGGAEKKKSVSGIPVTMKQSATSYSQAVEILSELKSKGADNIVASYVNWTDYSMENRIDTTAEPSYTLGYRRDFSRLKEFADENNISLYPAVHNRDFISGNGYNLFHACIRASGAYSRIVSYDRAYGIPDGRLKNKSLVSPKYFSKIYSETALNYSSRQISGIFPQYLTSSLYGDYSRNKISRFQAMQYTTDTLESLSESLDILADCANAYALPYVSHITDMPLSSGQYDIFSEDVPFMQIVLHGVVPYATVVNSSPNPTESLLKAVAMGSMPCYDIIAEETDVLKNTELDVYYYARSYGTAEKYALIKPIFENISESTITDYQSDGSTITTTYSNGTVIVTDLNKQTVNFNGKEIYMGEE